MAKIVAITSCPTGIAHTFMAAEGVQQGAEALGHTVKVETQGSVGSQNTLTETEIQEADVVIIAADTKVDMSRFAGKAVYETSTNAAIKDGKAVVTAALAYATANPASAPKSNYVAQVQAAKAAQHKGRRGPYKHLLTGVSYMIPFVVAGGILIALSFAIAGYQVVFENNPTPSFGYALFEIGAKGGFALFVPILSGYIAYSIADRPGLAPGMIGGVLAGLTGSGFLGGIIAGFLAGYAVYWLNRTIKLPRTFAGIMPVLVLPLLGTLIVGLLMVYVVGYPVAQANTAMVNGLKGLGTTNGAFLGLLLGAMMAFDMGGPVNKAAYVFATGLLASNITAPMAAVMAAGMTPPLGLALASLIFKNRFTADEREAGKAAWVLGISFITEGAIPFAAEDPFRVIPSIMTGSAIAGALSMIFGAQLHVPHGGVWVLFLPNVVDNLFPYILSIVIGTAVTAGALFLLKRPLKEEKEVVEQAEAPSPGAVAVA
jgi:PTS system fructose-specific IIC component